MDVSLLHQYRRDRRRLLSFLLSSGIIKEIRTSTGIVTSISDADLDFLSTDYVLDCIKSGAVLDVSTAIEKFHEASAYPVMIHSKLGDSYFLLSDPSSAGSPPRRTPPPVMVSNTNHHVSRSASALHTSSPQAADVRIEVNNVKDVGPATPSLNSSKNISIRPIGLPPITAGLSDDGVQELAYEILLTSLTFSGIEVYKSDYKRKDKSSKFLRGSKSKRERDIQECPPDRHSKLLDTIRSQMQISEAFDLCIRRRLMQIASLRSCEGIDIPSVLLGLLNGIYVTYFPSEKSYMQWKNRQVQVLEELLSFANDKIKQREMRTLFARIYSMEWDSTMSPSERTEVLSAVERVVSALSSIPPRFGIPDESYYWSSGYHVNIRLYEKLLFGLFDILEEGQLIEEADDVLKLIKSTWSILGINQQLHYALFGWVLFQQFVGTNEPVLLDYALVQLQKFFSEDNIEKNEEEYMESLLCSIDTPTKLSLTQSICLSISTWCDNKLQDYHLNFSQNPDLFRMTLMLAFTVEHFCTDEHVENTLADSEAQGTKMDFKKLTNYVRRSIQAACQRAASTMDIDSELGRTYPLAQLANKLRLITERELNVFCPVLRQWDPTAGRDSAIILHQYFGERLKPFLEGITSLSEEVRSVLPAADMLNRNLTQLLSSTYNTNGVGYSQQLQHYQIGEVCKPLVLDWIIDQQAHILEWAGRAFELEDWEPLSHQQRQAASAVEVFRITEETVDQLFGLNLPMDKTHLQALLSVIFHTLDMYLVKVVNLLVEKHHLYPATPPLTRYEETILQVMKKKLVSNMHIEVEITDKLNRLTISKLCVILNTLQYMQRQIGALEDGIKNSWALVQPSEYKQFCTSEDSKLTDEESIRELFAATFDCIKDTASIAIKKFREFTGAKVVFWDLRDSFLFHLYSGSVEGAGMDSVLHYFDTVLNQVCGLIDESTRDPIVLSIFKASLEGFVWVLLDGGPSRAFSLSDITVMEDDLKILKDFFIADGEGLPRSLAEKEASFAHQVLNLFTLQTESLVQMLMTASKHIAVIKDREKHRNGYQGDAHTFIRVLCHKKDREASKFLKRQYELPASSEYEDPTSDKSQFATDLLKRSASVRWSGSGQGNLNSFKQKLQRATSEIRHTAW
ncbi:protein unc-13 homolog isoform X1 [Impatiens glandulifera]|uniref:protein unc-13 homolog isoform X1 n=1 Tax=Impatiens glandulifera TaxID=253017 RepID=UPI001FB09692|nr:protein unc-13 homolog isoform X1 [Impatiens glandulifera]